jgi:hypothetical protein
MSHVSRFPTPYPLACDEVRPVERVVLYGEPGARPADARAEDLEALMQRAWTNLFEAMRKAGFERRHLVMTTVCVTEGGQFKLFRAVRVPRMIFSAEAPVAHDHSGAPTLSKDRRGSYGRAAAKKTLGAFAGH